MRSLVFSFALVSFVLSAGASYASCQHLLNVNCSGTADCDAKRQAYNSCQAAEARARANASGNFGQSGNNDVVGTPQSAGNINNSGRSVQQ